MTLVSHFDVWAVYNVDTVLNVFDVCIVLCCPNKLWIQSFEETSLTSEQAIEHGRRIYLGRFFCNAISAAPPILIFCGKFLSIPNLGSGSECVHRRRRSRRRCCRYFPMRVKNVFFISFRVKIDVNGSPQNIVVLGLESAHHSKTMK